MKIKLLLPFILILAGLFLPAPAAARKKIPARIKTAVVKTNLPQSSLRLRGDKLALLLKLVNLSEAKAIDYRLTYNSTQAPQGVEGSLDPTIGSTQKELVFGTCAGTVCTYHTGIADMRFQLTVGLKSGKTLVRKYTIKI